MNIESVVKFLGRVPLVRALPSSSLKKIAEVVTVKHYDEGAYIVREGKAADGIYFIWDGEAEVCGAAPIDDRNRAEFQLKQYDYFGQGVESSTQPADILALSKLTCLLLPNASTHLLRSASIWSADKAHENRLLIEQVLHLDPVGIDIFRGVTVLSPGHVFGGQFLGQALAAASKTVDCHKIVHSFHAYFLIAGDVRIPITYQVHRLRDGKTFATRRTDAMQKGKVVFTLIASFQNEEEGFEHQVARMPSVPNPEELLSEEELRERHCLDPRLPRMLRNMIAMKYVPWPIEIRFCEPNFFTSQTKSPPSLRFWLRAKETLPDDQAFHRCVVAFASDRTFIEVSCNPHRESILPKYISLDHSIWFHRHFRADEWLLFVIYSPNAHSGRGFVSGQMFTRNGELVVSLTQEGLLGRAKPPVSPVRSNL